MSPKEFIPDGHGQGKPAEDRAAHTLDRVATTLERLASSAIGEGIRRVESVPGAFSDFGRQAQNLSSVLRVMGTDIGATTRQFSVVTDAMRRNIASIADGHRKANVTLFSSERQYGALLSQRARAESLAFQQMVRGQRVEGGLLQKAVDFSARNVTPTDEKSSRAARAKGKGNTPGDYKAVLEDLRNQARAEVAGKAKEALGIAAQEHTAANLLAKGNEREHGPFLFGESAKYDALAGANRRATAEADARRTYGLGGADKAPPFVAQALIDQLRARQRSAAWTGNVKQDTERLETLQQEVQLAKQRAEYLASDAGVKAAREQLRMMRELERQARRNRRNDPVAQQQEWADEWKRRQGMWGIGAGGLQRASALATTGGIAASSVADPFVTMPTLFESIKSVGIEIGTIVNPVLNSLSGHLQRVSQFLGTMSDESRISASRMLIWTVAGGVAVAAAVRLTVALRGLYIAWQAGQIAISGALTWGGALTGGLGLVAGAVAALSAEYLLLGKNASTAARAMGDATVGQLTGSTERARRIEQLRNNLPREVQDALGRAGDEPAARANIIQRYIRQLEEDLQQRRARVPLFPESGTPQDNREAALATRQGPMLRADVDREMYRTRHNWIEDRLANPFRAPETDIQRLERIRRETARSHAGRLYQTEMDAGRAPDPGFVRRMTDNMLRVLRGQSPTGGVGREAAREAQSGIASTEGMLTRARELFEAIGGGQTLAAFKSPVQPAMLDAMAYSERLSLAGLRGDDMSAKNLERQLQLANEVLDRIENNTRVNNGGLVPGQVRPFRR